MRQFILHARVLIVIATLVVTTAAGLAWSQRTTTSTETQFEYWLVEVDVGKNTFPSRVVQERLNELGRSGWELVEIRDAIGNDNAFWLFMKQEAR